jgi:hypothetical protein
LALTLALTLKLALQIGLTLDLTLEVGLRLALVLRGIVVVMRIVRILRWMTHDRLLLEEHRRDEGAPIFYVSGLAMKRCGLIRRFFRRQDRH